MNPIDTPKDIGSKVHRRSAVPIFGQIFAELLHEPRHFVCGRRPMPTPLDFDFGWTIDARVFAQPIHQNPVERENIGWLESAAWILEPFLQKNDSSVELAKRIFRLYFRPFVGIGDKLRLVGLTRPINHRQA